MKCYGRTDWWTDKVHSYNPLPTLWRGINDGINIHWQWVPVKAEMKIWIQINMRKIGIQQNEFQVLAVPFGIKIVPWTLPLLIGIRFTPGFINLLWTKPCTSGSLGALFPSVILPVNALMWKSIGVVTSFLKNLTFTSSTDLILQNKPIWSTPAKYTQLSFLTIY